MHGFCRYVRVVRNLFAVYSERDCVYFSDSAADQEIEDNLLVVVSLGCSRAAALRPGSDLQDRTEVVER